MKIGDKIRVIRNRCYALRPESRPDWSQLEPGDIVTITGFVDAIDTLDNMARIRYQVCAESNVYNSLYLEDVELVEVSGCICDTSVLMISGCKCGWFQKEKENNK